MVSLWDLLTVLCGASAFSGALAAAKITGGGSLRLVMGISLGLGLGILSMSAVRMGCRRVDRSSRLGGATSTRTEVALRLLYFAAALWIVISLFLSVKITQSVIRLMLP